MKIKNIALAFRHLLASSLTAALASALLLISFPATAQMKQTAVFHRFEHGYDTFRIPAIVQTQEGTLLAFAEARRINRDDSGDIDMVVKRSTDGGKTWGELIKIWDDGANVCGNPAPVVLRENGRILLVTCWNDGRDDEVNSYKSRRVFDMYSDDDGLTWSKPREITDSVKEKDWGWYATGPCHAIQLESGRIVVPCNHGFWDPQMGTDSHVIYSDDLGETWHIGGDPKKGNESTIVELDNGDLLFNMRTHMHDWVEGSYRLAAVSHDGGLTFEEPYYDHYLIEDQCNASIINYAPAGKKTGMILFCNPEATDSRDNMAIRMSKDNGKTWERVFRVNKGPAGYSDLCVLPDGDVGVLYETGIHHYNETISFGRVPARFINPDPDQVVPLYPQGQDVDLGIVENGKAITLGPGENNGIVEKDNPHEYYVYRQVGDHAKLELYFPPECNGQMVVVLPGGGYSVIAGGNAGRDVAKWLNQKGIAACVVIYRLPNGHPQVPLTDVQNAFRYCRHHAAEWGVRQMGVMGFSAGGHLAAMASNLYTDAITRPDFAALIYPVIDLNDHEGTGMQLVGKNKKLRKQYSMQYAVTSDTPVTFISTSQDDPVVDIHSSIEYFRALKAHGVQSQMHMLPIGGHGYGFLPPNIDGGLHDRLGNYRMIFLRNIERFLEEIRPELEEEDE